MRFVVLVSISLTCGLFLVGCGGSATPKSDTTSQSTQGAAKTSNKNDASQSNIDADALLAKAKKHYENGEQQKGAELLNQIMAARPNHAPTLQVRAGILARAGQLPAAVSDLTKAIAASPDEAILYNMRGFLYLSVNDFQRAIKDFDVAIEKDGKFAKAFNNRGLAKISLKDFGAAINDFNQALLIDTEYVDAFNNRGYAHLEWGNYAKAIDDFTWALKLNPDYFNAYNNRGTVRMKTGEIEEAISDYTRAIELAPTAIKHYLHRREAYLAIGDLKAARKDLQKVDWLRKLVPLNQLIAQQPDNTAARLERAAHYLKNGDSQLALADARMVADQDQESALAFLIQGKAFLQLKKFDDAVDACTKAIKLEPLPDAYSARGDAYLGLEKVDDAIADFTKAQRFDSAVARAFLKRAEQLDKNGKSELAEEARAQAIALDPNLTTTTK